jgi:hypothetical protein
MSENYQARTRSMTPLGERSKITFCTGYWVISDNRKRSPEHYTKYIPRTLRLISGHNLIVFYEDDGVLRFFEKYCRLNGISIFGIRVPVMELPAYALSAHMLECCRSMEGSEYLNGDPAYRREKGRRHYQRDYILSGADNYRKIISIWTSKVPLVAGRAIPADPFGSDYFAWIDASVSRFNRARSNWNFMGLTYNDASLHHYGSISYCMGVPLRLNASFLLAHKDVWPHVQAKYEQQLEASLGESYAHDEETLLSRVVQENSGLFTRIGINYKGPRKLLYKLSLHVDKALQNTGKHVIPRVLAAGKFVSRIKTRGRMSFSFRDRFFKVLFLSEARKVGTEAIARNAHEAAPWRHMDNITNDILFTTRYCGIVTARLASGSKPGVAQCVAISHHIMSHIPQDCEWKSVFDVIDGRVADILQQQIDPALRALVHDSFQNTALPVTGAHGDFGCSNVLVDEDDCYRTIDWECFRQGGSCIEDICRLLATAIRSDSNPGNDVRELQDSRIMDVIEQGGYLTHDQCILLYALSQASCELEKKKEAEVAERMTERLRRAVAKGPVARLLASPARGLAAFYSTPAPGA